jgi:hypothetical protein
MDFSDWLLLLPLIVLVFYIMRRVLVMRALGRIRYGGMRMEPLPKEKIPAWFTEAALPHADALKAHGFVFRRALRGANLNGLGLDVFFLEYIPGPVAPPPFSGQPGQPG